MKKLITSIIIAGTILFVASSTFAEERKNTLMDNEYASYKTCKNIILRDIVNRQALCINSSTGDKRHCVNSPSEINGEIRSECGVDPVNKKPSS